jgi:predicted membrane protein
MSEPRGNRPWFGQKRVGFRLRPQTWQGWLITLLSVVVVIVVVTLAKH